MINEIKNYINDEENGKLLSYFDTDLTDFEATNTSNYLIAEGLFVNPSTDVFLMNLVNKILSTIGRTYEYVDYVNFMKYDVNGRFKSHYDFIDTSTSSNIEDLKQGGQREYTFLIYLNEDCVGGETHFSIMNKTINPEKNKMIWWKNTLDDGSQNILVKHESKKIISGTKYLVGIWVRQQKVHNKEKKLL
jgi:prolyl 4-hydroxylase